MENPQGPIIVEQDGWVSSSLSMGKDENAVREELQASGAEPGEQTPPEVPAKPATPAEGEAAAEEQAAAGAEGEEAAAAAAEGEPATPAEPEKPRRRNRAQERIDALTRDNHEQRERADRLEARLAAIEKAGGVVTPAARAEATAATAAAERADYAATHPEPAWDGPGGFEEQGKSWADFQKAHNQWVFGQAAAVAQAEIAKARKEDDTRRQTETAQQSQQRVKAEFDERMAVTRAKHADFDTTVREIADVRLGDALDMVVLHSPHGPELLYHLGQNPDTADTVADLFNSISDPARLRPLADGLLDSEVPGKILDHFAAKPEEFARISALPPARMLLALGRLSATLAAPTSPSPAGVAPAVSTRPVPPKPPAKPLRTVGGGAPPTKPNDGSAGVDLDFGPEYVDRMNREEAARRRRRL